MRQCVNIYWNRGIYVEGRRARFVVDPVGPVEGPVDFVLVTHGHSDHVSRYMRLVQRREPYPLGYAVALAGSLATTLAAVLLATNRLDSALAVLAITDWGFYLRVFAVVGIVAMSQIPRRG